MNHHHSDHHHSTENRMNHNIFNNNYLIIPNFITSYRADKLKQEFQKFAIDNNLSGDSQSTNSQSFHNYVSFLELLCEKTPKVSEILQETVLPTYAYSRVYNEESVLEPHVDRDACEISLTLHLGGDKPWPIWIKTPSDENHCVLLNPGDAMMYLGCVAPHWRERYDGEKYVQVFLHYVRSRGDKFYAYFDKTNVEPGIDDNKTKDVKKNNNEDDIVVNQDRKKIFVNAKPDSKLENFVEVFDDAISEEFCNLITQEYINSEDWQTATVEDDNTVNNSIRRCNIIPISNNFIISKNFETRKKIDNIIYDSILYSKKLYEDKHGPLSLNGDSGYELLRYNEGQYYGLHIDDHRRLNEHQRIVSCSIQLNDNYDGGEFAFFGKEMLIRSKKGSIIMFPSNFLYPHEITPVTQGTRYSIITWLL